MALQPVDELVFYGFSQETAEEIISKGEFDAEEDDVYTLAEVHIEVRQRDERFGRLCNPG